MPTNSAENNVCVKKHHRREKTIFLSALASRVGISASVRKEIFARNHRTCCICIPLTSVIHPLIKLRKWKRMRNWQNMRKFRGCGSGSGLPLQPYQIWRSWLTISRFDPSRTSCCGVIWKAMCLPASLIQNLCYTVSDTWKSDGKRSKKGIFCFGQ